MIKIRAKSMKVYFKIGENQWGKADFFERIIELTTSSNMTNEKREDINY